MWVALLLLACCALAAAQCPLNTSGLTGEVVTRTNLSFANASLNWNANPFIKQGPPCVVVFCLREVDAANALGWALSNKLPFAVRSGRHSYEGFSLSPDGLIIDVSPLNTMRYDGRRTGGFGRFAIGAGVRLADAYLFVGGHGFLMPGGSCPNVAISGFTLGGGFGLSSRLVGLAIDALVGVRLVTADGEIRHASATEHADLFWALRGGGNGNFGIVTLLEFDLPPVPTASGNVTIVTAAWANPASLVKAEVVNAWTAWLELAPASVTSELTLYHHSVSLLALFYANASTAAASLGGVFAAAGGVTTSSFSEVPYLTAMLDFAGCDNASACAVVAAAEPSAESPIFWKAKSFYANEPLSANALGVIEQYLEPAASNCCTGFSGLILDSYGGAIARVSPNATAFPHRQALFHMQLMVYFTGASQAAGAQAWASAFGTALAAELGPRCSYRNYPDLDLGPAYAAAYYGANLEALCAIKARVDPDNVFRYAQSIPPASPLV